MHANTTATANDQPREIYSRLRTQYDEKAKSLGHRLGWLSFFRLLLFCGFLYAGYRAIVSGEGWLILLTIALLVLFLFLIRLYDRMQQETAFYKALSTLNQVEIAFLDSNSSPYATGKEYTDPQHAYSYDLDLFGDGGLFPYLNRCSTSFGKEALAATLLRPDTTQIQERQEAILELASQLEFRQHLQAHGSLLDTKEKEMRQLNAWLASKSSFTNKTLYYFLLLFPVATIGSLVYYLVTEREQALNSFYFLFVLNLVIAVSFAKIISAHLSVSTSVTKILQQFAGQLRQVETRSFHSSLLKKYQAGLRTGAMPASQSIVQLSSLFNYLETIVNLVVTTLLNGLFLFHVHILFRLENWKKQNGHLIIDWLRLLGEVEALNSLANLAYNNRTFCRPEVSTTETLVADDMGHVLIKPGKRINNGISFSEQRFVVLTGSNMSGKSTFLRTLGLNLVLARTGSVVCAKQFVFFPYAVHVSMRISDSLQDSESFFYAELKRLQAIIQQLQAGDKTFVILDEILRGTNSDDKHNGTVGLIRKLVAARACGIIATHDLTVSRLADENPNYISKQCFESEIINDELLFDYKLKPGVCTRLSASFLMKKMGIIE